MQKIPPLFRTKKEFIIAILFLTLIFLSRIFFIYHDYNNLTSQEPHYANAKIINIYKSKQGNIVKIKTENDITLYFKTSYKLQRFNWIRLRFYFKKKPSFFKFLKGFFVIGKIVNRDKNSFNPKQKVKEQIYKQHKDAKIASFYGAIFLAEPIDKNLREQIANLGISHLVAISGFHLGILWALIYGLGYLIYRPLQQKFFPWRNRVVDLGFISLVALFVFTLFIGSPPSVIRSFAMLFVGWLAYVLGVEVLSFKFLIFSALTVLAIFPKLIISYGFILSFSGVFYIFLLLKYFQKANKWLLNLVIVPFGVFALMFPISHYFFGNFTPWQFFSPIISILFVPFYPLAVLIHLLGLGDIADVILENLFNLPKISNDFFIPWWLMLPYIGVSIVAIREKKVFYILLIIAIALLLFHNNS